MNTTFAKAERVLASVAGLCLFTLNDVRMFQALPRQPDPGNGQTHAIAMQLMGAAEPVYATALDLAVRWGLAGVTAALCCWAVAETFSRQTVER